ncbi:redoxin domain-containing protein [Tropicibacter sp. R16_0]|uniref:redoxin domain-containing protein n=1 Tax=Tropicibacter sp. R16_0 TaxID=2821102 RepID=UPI001ADA78F7|nr:redoxin domain-containing protein [Tropicibacter sp. R16_0]MBO9449860.1 redoxin domain-containing protein [Tropicibacter sp. R16_0]
MQAPELQVTRWFNTDEPLKLSDFQGKVVLIEAFQMLCPGCVIHGIPLAQDVQRQFSNDQVAVIGLHTVFEHHEAMTPVSLKAFLREYRITFPVAVDKQGAGPLPETMTAYGMRGTPSLVLLDQSGRIAAHHFGQVSPLQLGAEIGRLLAGGPGAQAKEHQPGQSSSCDGDGCPV